MLSHNISQSKGGWHSLNRYTCTPNSSLHTVKPSVLIRLYAFTYRQNQFPFLHTYMHVYVCTYIPNSIHAFFFFFKPPTENSLTSMCCQFLWSFLLPILSWMAGRIPLTSSQTSRNAYSTAVKKGFLCRTYGIGIIHSKVMCCPGSAGIPLECPNAHRSFSHRPILSSCHQNLLFLWGR